MGIGARVSAFVVAVGLMTAGCTSSGSGPVDGSQPPSAGTRAAGVHLIAPEGWEDATLVSGPSNGLAAHRTEMSAAGDVFVADLPEGDTYFRFENDKGSSLDLGGTMGTYPGDPPEDFTTGLKNLWVDEYGLLHASDPRTPNDAELTVLTVNLHTYQDRSAITKLHRVAAAIDALGADIVMLQEAAQNKDAPVVRQQYGVDIREGNAALVIADQLKSQYQQDYDFFWDWSHYGWDVWEEGSAILTHDQIEATESRFVTKNQEKTFWKSRNIPMARIKTPSNGTVNAYSVHLGWWDDTEEPFKYQFDQLLDWTKSNADTADSQILGGDFNNPAGTVGYDYIISESGFTDVYLSVNPNGLTDPTIGGRIDGWEEGDAEGKRIDYLFLTPGSTLTPVLSQRTFTESSMGRVSDHNGTYATFVNGAPLPSATPSASASADAAS